MVVLGKIVNLAQSDSFQELIVTFGCYLVLTDPCGGKWYIIIVPFIMARETEAESHRRLSRHAAKTSSAFS